LYLRTCTFSHIQASTTGDVREIGKTQPCGQRSGPSPRCY
jgi:hypothetical protein